MVYYPETTDNLITAAKDRGTQAKGTTMTDEQNPTPATPVTPTPSDDKHHDDHKPAESTPNA